LNQLSAGLKNKTVLNKLIISYTPETYNYKFTSPSSKIKQKLGAAEIIIHGDTGYTTNKVLFDSL
jgi:hypothetical protein